MRLKSFVKLPKYKRFTFEPRYYDPVKEEIENRERLIKSAYQRKHKLGDQKEYNTEVAKHRISDAFQSRQREGQKSVMIQVFIAVILLAITAVALLNIDKWL